MCAAHHGTAMAAEMASLKCHHSSINQSPARNNNAPPAPALLPGLLRGIGCST
uniref:Uncharacterized protein n=1 Tax=Denticeps clupeoides TaxID=299321 RepID=A0AAY4BXQ2_9TELE